MAKAIARAIRGDLRQQTESLCDKDAPTTCAAERLSPMCVLIRKVKMEFPVYFVTLGAGMLTLVRSIVSLLVC